MIQSLDSNPDLGQKMHQWARELWPINRSLSGPGVRQTLEFLKQQMPNLQIQGIPTGTTCFDWTVPAEWEIRDAYILNEKGEKILDFKKNNLHVVGYSTAIDRKMTLEQLQSHLHSLPEQPTAIPYVTSYYSSRWGFCLSHQQRQSLMPGLYHVVIDSTHRQGALTYGELRIPGRTEKEILLSTYVCHPSMANNELSGPVVTTALAQWIAANQDREFSYRILFLPETIGSIAYLSRHLDEMKKNTVAGFVVTCVGDERCHSFMPSREGQTLADRAGLHVLKYLDPQFKKYSFLQRGSDERQYCSPRADLPVASLMRSKYAEFPEYHTSLDDLNFVTPRGLAGGFEALQRAIFIIENNGFPEVQVTCEPQLGKRGLYPTVSAKGSADSVRTMMNLIAYSDGSRDLIEIADLIGASALELIPITKKLTEHNLLKFENHRATSRK
jgi:aminopeptidase-like protein